MDHPLLRTEFSRTAPPRATRIRVVRMPTTGEAPEEVRKAWVGLELPLHAPGVRRTNEYGLLSAPNSRLLRWIRSRLGLVHPTVGYAVAARVAVDELAKKAPHAAQWFRQNIPHVLSSGGLLFFEVEVCRTIETEPYPEFPDGK
jgi:hypothetical protein